MAFAPKLEDYDVKILIILGNQTKDVFSHNQIKFLIIKKLLELDYSIFYLVAMFIRSEKILKEAYAEILVMKMKDNEYFIDDITCDKIIKLVSLDTLMFYGMESNLESFREKCKLEFWERAMEIENKDELNKKINLCKKHRYKIKKIRKGDLNDKY